MITVTVGDIDIDLADRTSILSIIDHVPAKLENGKKHNTSVYVQDIPFNPLTMLSEDDYKTLEYTKIDFLHLTALKQFRSNDEIIHYLHKEPNWGLLLDEAVVQHLPQIHDHYDLIQKVQPKSIEDLITILHSIREHSQYKFKRSHACAYALTIVMLMNKLEDHLDLIN